ncbi:uncharacterized protein [Physcomitrium patens]|uniref:Enoyl reductase (ER) domain-containing protein n=1 Tax=Physcomitrium patens TaxID=3218 RepID=A0A7I4A3Y6_PHYPA|nr:uncharacterized protein LOC112287254 isoform X2 [Physcomitrium patens]|eukprot:XP_024385859.1 uncharacterized protein LOC112287254 isoform X2 [Physcomitrella patens]
MVKAVRVHAVGGRHHLQLEEVELPHPGCDEVEVRHRAIGFNYPDMEDCRGVGHHTSHSIFTPGLSAVGVITELGTGVLNHQIGQRVGYVNPPKKGAFSETSILPTNCLIPLPSNIADEEAAALLFPGLTAWMTLKKLKPLRRGDAVLVRNVTSGLGSIIAQWAKHFQAFVIGTVSSEDRVEHAKNNGCREVLVNRDEASSQCGFADEVRELTSGEGVDVAFDSIGNNTFMASLDCLAPKGMLVSLGAKGGDAPVLNLNYLADCIVKEERHELLLYHLKGLFSYSQTQEYHLRPPNLQNKTSTSECACQWDMRSKTVMCCSRRFRRETSSISITPKPRLKLAAAF